MVRASAGARHPRRRRRQRRQRRARRCRSPRRRRPRLRRPRLRRPRRPAEGKRDSEFSGRLTRLPARVGQREPEGEDDGEEQQVRALLADALPRERHVQRLGRHLVQLARRGPRRRSLSGNGLPLPLRRRPAALRDTNLFLQWCGRRRCKAWCCGRARDARRSPKSCRPLKIGHQ